MAHGFISQVAAPVEMYDAVHHRLLERVGLSVDGLLLHLGRGLPDGFQVIEVWSSKERLDHYNQHVVLPLLAELSGGAPPDALPQTQQEFDVRGLIVPSAGIAF